MSILLNLEIKNQIIGAVEQRGSGDKESTLNMDDIFNEIHGIFLNTLTRAEEFTYSSLIKKESLIGFELFEGWYLEYMAMANILMLLVVAIYASVTTWEVNVNIHAALGKIKELFPRLVIGFLMINGSIFFCEFVITVHNLLIDGLILITAETIDEVFSSEPSNWGVLHQDLLLLIFLTISALTLAFVNQGRQLLIYFLTLISPLSCLLWVVPDTSAWFWMWLKEFITWSLVPFFQLTLLILGMGIMIQPMGMKGSISGIFTLIALYFLMASMPFVIRNWVTRMFVKIKVPGGFIE